MSLKLDCIQLYCKVRDGATVNEISTRLDVPLLELYPLLEILTEENLVTNQGSEYVVTPQSPFYSD